MSVVKIDPGEDRVRDVRGNAIANARIIVDYHESSIDRKAALLQVNDYSSGSGDVIEFATDNDGTITMIEGNDFTLGSDNISTAQNIRDVMNNITNIGASIPPTSHAWEPYVSIHYTNGHFTDVHTEQSGDDTLPSSAWQYKNYNPNVCSSVPPCEAPIAAIYAYDSGSLVQDNQPQFSNSKGYYSFYMANKADVDFFFEHPSATFTETHISDITLSGGANVVTPGSTTDNAIARWMGTTGSEIANSRVTIDESDPTKVTFKIDGTEIFNVDDL